MENIVIVEFEEKYHADFKRLSYEWLEKYALAEPADDQILNHPREVILDRGGFIFFVKFADQVVGTISMIKIDETAFELAKLAVTAEYQGLRIGTRLMEKCLNVARNAGSKRIILYTNHVLIAAIALYNKFGFKEAPFESNKYQESDMKMELNLS